MNRFEELARLKELEAEATPARWSLTRHSDDILEISREDGARGFQILFEDLDIDDPQFITDIRNAAPWLLKIAEAFQPGDALLLSRVAMIIGQSAWREEYAKEYEMLRRLQAAAEELER